VEEKKPTGPLLVQVANKKKGKGRTLKKKEQYVMTHDSALPSEGRTKGLKTNARTGTGERTSHQEAKTGCSCDKKKKIETGEGTPKESGGH